MSAGKFVDAKYLSSETGQVHPIKVQPETLSLTLGGETNVEAGSAISNRVSVKVSGSSRSIGVKPRYVTLQWTGTVPDGYDPNGTLKVPVLTPPFYNGIIPKESVGSYLGNPVKVLSKAPERLR